MTDAPPQNVEAEQSVLGAVLLSDTALPALIIDERLNAEDFYRESHGRIYQAMLDLHSMGEPVDALTLVEHLKQAGDLETVGGAATIELLAGSVPAVGNLRQYARIVRENAMLRRLLHAAYGIQAQVLNHEAPPQELVRSAERAIQGVLDRSVDGGSEWLGGEPLDPLADPAEPLATIPGCPFAHRGASILVSGPTGGGRSSLLGAVLYDAARAGLRGAYLSGEVGAAEFNARAADLAGRRGDGVDETLRADLARVRFLDTYEVMRRAWVNPAAWVQAVTERYDIVALDPLSTVAAALDLDFDASNRDYAAFHDRLIRPLVGRGLVVLLAENIGRNVEARERAKGASAKADKADISIACKLRAQPAGLILKATKVRSVRAPFRNRDVWVFDRDSQLITAEQSSSPDASEAFRPTALMERVSRVLEDEPGLSRNAIRTSVKGKASFVDLALELLVSEGFVEVHRDGQAHRHHSKRAFRDTESQPGPDRVPDSVGVTGSRVPLPIGDPDPVPGREIADTGSRTAADLAAARWGLTPGGDPC